VDLSNALSVTTEFINPTRVALSSHVSIPFTLKALTEVEIS
jgi:hypothetical protein